MEYITLNLSYIAFVTSIIGITAIMFFGSKLYPELRKYKDSEQTNKGYIYIFSGFLVSALAFISMLGFFVAGGGNVLFALIAMQICWFALLQSYRMIRFIIPAFKRAPRIDYSGSSKESVRANYLLGKEKQTGETTFTADPVFPDSVSNPIFPDSISKTNLP